MRRIFVAAALIAWLVQPGGVGGFGEFGDAVARGAIAYTITDLGPVDDFAQPRALNNHGDAIVAQTGGSFLYTHGSGTFTALNTLTGAANSVGLAINDSGDFVGTHNDLPYVYHNGVRIDLASFGGQYTLCWSINSAGQIVGESQTSAGPRHAFSWKDLNHNNHNDPGEMVDLGIMIAGGESFARDVNDAGVIVGMADVVAFDNWKDVMRWGSDAAPAQNLNLRGDAHANAAAVNGAGVIVGNYDPHGGNWRGFAWSDGGGFVDLGFSKGSTSVGAEGINSAGQVVGYTGANAFIWSSTGGLKDLNTMIDPASGWRLDAAFAINDAGQILGRAQVGTAYRAFLLTPLPEPGAALPVAVALLGVRRRHRRVARVHKNRRPR
jgi:probable HAF family extracellular repeat protein